MNLTINFPTMVQNTELKLNPDVDSSYLYINTESYKLFEVNSGVDQNYLYI